MRNNSLLPDKNYRFLGYVRMFLNKTTKNYQVQTQNKLMPKFLLNLN